MAVVGEIVAHLAGVVVQEVHRFAHFGDGVVEGFTRFTHQNAQQALQLTLHQLGGAFEDRGALRRRRSEPDWAGGRGGVERTADFAFGGFTYVADHIARLGRVDHRLLHALIHPASMIGSARHGWLALVSRALRARPDAVRWTDPDRWS